MSNHSGMTTLRHLFLLTGVLMGNSMQAAGLTPKIMEDETVVFCSDLQDGTAKLLFPATKILKVQRADGSQEYKEGVDFTLDEGRLLRLTPKSKIPILTYYTHVKSGDYRSPAGADRFFYSPGGTQKHKKYDIRVTYAYENGDFGKLCEGATESKLAPVIQRLKNGDARVITFFGDSITFGAQASALDVKCTNDAIFGLPYTQAVFQRLKKRYPASASLAYFNKAVGGKTSKWGVETVGEVNDTKPDIAIIAFGMNDSSGKIPSATYIQNTRAMIESIRGAKPDAAIILIAEFSPNPELGIANYELRAENRRGLHSLFQEFENIAFVDVGHVSRQIAATKKFQDFSGNNINHPNDFLHRIYADLVMKVFGE